MPATMSCRTEPMRMCRSDRGAPFTPCGTISVLVSRRVVLEDEVCPATIIISKETGKIIGIETSILHQDMFPASTDYRDYSSFILMPGLVDSHVHFNEPGRTSAEGFFTGTRAAISGGVTTIIDMPLNSIPPTTTVAGLRTKIDASQGKCWSDVGFLGGIIPGNQGELKPLVKAGVRGFKSFLIESGVPEFPMVRFNDLRKAMLELADSPTALIFHAEKPPNHQVGTPDAPAFLYPNGDEKTLWVYDNFLASRPPAFEDEAIKMLIELSHFAPKLPLHVAHVSTAEALPILRKAQEANVNISAETCFHYLCLSSEEVPLRDTRFKSEPPIRNKANQNQLWKALQKLEREEEDKHQQCRWSLQSQQTARKPKKDLRRGPITTIVSDHSPCSPDAKLLPSYIPPHSEALDYHDEMIPTQAGNFSNAWGGIATVGLGLQVLWTEIHHRKMLRSDDKDFSTPEEASNIAIRDVVNWCCRNTAELVGLGRQKGRLQIGYDGDVCVFDPDAEWTLTAQDLHFRHKMTPYEGRQLRGRVMATWLRGNHIWELGGHGQGFIGMGPEGHLLLEERRPEVEPHLQDTLVEPVTAVEGTWNRVLSLISPAYNHCLSIGDDTDEEDQGRLFLPTDERSTTGGEKKLWNESFT